ncbi:hypothetical protein SUGI_0015560 [Cryptomeria japonica]|nr:hypothetical protein SUGI_0015560 [Cryptomeria japonica]
MSVGQLGQNAASIPPSPVILLIPFLLFWFLARNQASIAADLVVNLLMCNIAGVEMAGAALNLAVIIVMVMISVVFGAEEAEAPSPSLITGAASMAVAPSLAAALVGSLVAFLAFIFH